MMRLAQLVFAAAAALTLSGCSSGDTYLDALQADVMARWEPDGAQLVSESTQGYDSGGAGSKQSLAQVIRVFRLPSPVDVGSAQRQGLTHAQGEGDWRTDGVGRDGFLQRPGPDGSTMTLSVLPSVTRDTEIIVKLTAP